MPLSLRLDLFLFSLFLLTEFDGKLVDLVEVLEEGELDLCIWVVKNGKIGVGSEIEEFENLVIECLHPRDVLSVGAVLEVLIVRVPPDEK